MSTERPKLFYQLPFHVLHALSNRGRGGSWYWGELSPAPLTQPYGIACSLAGILLDTFFLWVPLGKANAAGSLLPNSSATAMARSRTPCGCTVLSAPWRSLPPCRRDATGGSRRGTSVRTIVGRLLPVYNFGTHTIVCCADSWDLTQFMHAAPIAILAPIDGEPPPSRPDQPSTWVLPGLLLIPRPPTLQPPLGYPARCGPLHPHLVSSLHPAKRSVSLTIAIVVIYVRLSSIMETHVIVPSKASPHPLTQSQSRGTSPQCQPTS